MKTQKSPAEQYYDKLASIYDEATSKHGSWTPPVYIAKELAGNKAKYKTALIIGVGTGKEIEILKSIGILHIEGIDISKNMIAQAFLKFQDAHLHHGDFMTFDGFKLSGYDLIVCSGTLEFISNFKGFFLKCSKLLSKSGELIVTYEPIVMGHKFQHEAQSETSPPDLSNKWAVQGFMTYRRSLSEFLTDIKNAELYLENFFEFVSYCKLDTDIIYHFARLKKVQ